MFQLAVQRFFLVLQLLLFYEIELILQIGNDQFRGAEKQFECAAIEPEHDGEFLQKAQASLMLRILFKLHPEGENFLRGQLIQTFRRCITVSCIVVRKIMLLRLQLQELLLNFRNAVLCVEHFVQFLGKRSRFLL